MSNIIKSYYYMCSYCSSQYEYMNISGYDLWLLRHDFLTHFVLQDLKLAQPPRSHNHGGMAEAIDKPRSETLQNVVQDMAG